MIITWDVKSLQRKGEVKVGPGIPLKPEKKTCSNPLVMTSDCVGGVFFGASQMMALKNLIRIFLGGSSVSAKRYTARKFNNKRP